MRGYFYRFHTGNGLIDPRTNSNGTNIHLFFSSSDCASTYRVPFIFALTRVRLRLNRQLWFWPSWTKVGASFPHSPSENPLIESNCSKLFPSSASCSLQRHDKWIRKKTNENTKKGGRNNYVRPFIQKQFLCTKKMVSFSKNSSLVCASKIPSDH